jgi:NAD(P)-dependent dehydrogenase (short-subunit alcohol dehydrogenase family)
MASDGRLAGKAAILTGAGSGLGKAAALRFGREGARVACADIDVDAARAVAAEIEAAGGMAFGVWVDTTSAAAVESMVGAAVESFGKVDVLFSNAGISGPGNAADVPEDLWDRVIAVNLKGVWLCARAVLPHMMPRRAGAILNQASMAALVGIDNIFPYTAAKGGVTAMTKQMAVAYGPYNIRVNAICPGTIPTPLVYRSRLERGVAAADADQQRLDAEVAERFPLKRLGVPEDVAAMAVFLASDEADWVTGGVFPVDGGRSAA